MALINCPECNKEISDTVNQCPNCGYTLKKKNKVNKKIILIIITCIIVIFCGISIKNSYEKAQAEKAAQEEAERLAEAEVARKQAEAEQAQKMLEIYYNLDISDVHGYKNDKAKGKLTNNSDTTVYFVQIKFTFSDNHGNIKDTDSTYACDAEGLDPGESCEFYVYNNYAFGAGERLLQKYMTLV